MNPLALIPLLVPGPVPSYPPVVVVTSGVVICQVDQGAGPPARMGDIVSLSTMPCEPGPELLFDTERRGLPYSYRLAIGSSLPTEAVVGMRPGEVRMVSLTTDPPRCLRITLVSIGT